MMTTALVCLSKQSEVSHYSHKYGLKTTLFTNKHPFLNVCLGKSIYSMATFIQPKSKCECVAMGGKKGIIEIWDLEKATFMMQFKGGNGAIFSLFTRGMVLAATDDKDGMLRVWSCGV